MNKKSPQTQQSKSLAEQMDIPLLMATILVDKGLTTRQEAETFLFPKLADLPDPFAMKDMGTATDLVINHLDNNIIIYGDYDVDGTTATALLATFFKQLGVKVYCFQPNRLTDGYGLTEKNISFLASQKSSAPPGLLISVDCGIASLDEVKFALKMGYRVIVTDHHEPLADLPEADAVLNPRRGDCPFPFKHLAGVGVAFYLAAGIRKCLVDKKIIKPANAPNLKNLLDFVALGTVADIMPLTDTNRILVRAGMEIMAIPSVRPGIKALADKCGIDLRELTTENISYRMAPRLNAAGRLGCAEKSLSLLCESSYKKAVSKAETLEEINNQRKGLESDSIAEVVDDCTGQVTNGARFLVHYGEHHPGIIGILASRMVDKFSLPALIFTDDTTKKGTLKGSARSIGNFDLLEKVSQCSNTLLGFGGHKAALGLSIEKGKLSDFQKAINLLEGPSENEKSIKQERKENLYPLSRDFFENSKNIKLLRCLEPYGNKNEEPEYVIQNAMALSTRMIQGKHIKFTIDGEKVGSLDAIAFNQEHKKDLLKNPVDLVVKLKRNSFRGQAHWQAHVYDIYPASY